jgi:hypothetical protein
MPQTPHQHTGEPFCPKCVMQNARLVAERRAMIRDIIPLLIRERKLAETRLQTFWSWAGLAAVGLLLAGAVLGRLAAGR